MKTPEVQWQLRHYNEMPSYQNGSYGHVCFNIVPIRDDGKIAYSDSVWDGIFSQDLCVRSQVDPDKDEAYAYEVCYHRPYSVGLYDVERMLATLKKIQKGLTKIAESVGPSRNFAEYVARVASVLKAKVVFVDDEKYEWVRTSGESIQSTQSEVDKVRKACRSVAGKSDDAAA